MSTADPTDPDEVLDPPFEEDEQDDQGEADGHLDLDLDHIVRPDPPASHAGESDAPAP